MIWYLQLDILHVTRSHEVAPSDRRQYERDCVEFEGDIILKQGRNRVVTYMFHPTRMKKKDMEKSIWNVVPKQLSCEI